MMRASKSLSHLNTRWVLQPAPAEEGVDLVAVAARAEDAAEPSVVLEVPERGLDAVSGGPGLVRRRSPHRVRSLRVMRGAPACCTGLLPPGLSLAAAVTVVDSWERLP